MGPPRSSRRRAARAIHGGVYGAARNRRRRAVRPDVRTGGTRRERRRCSRARDATVKGRATQVLGSIGASVRERGITARHQVAGITVLLADEAPAVAENIAAETVET